MSKPGDIKSPRVLKLKGLLFALIGTIATGMLFARDPVWETAILIVLATWAWCRFYYFLFYVLEHYAGRKRPCAGIVDAIQAIFREND